MILGGVTLPPVYCPIDMTIPRPKTFLAVMQTYTGVKVFNWGSILAGKELDLTWDVMTLDLFNSLDTLYQAGAAIVFNPDMVTGYSYNVVITDLDGKLIYGQDLAKRVDIKMKLVIESQV